MAEPLSEPHRPLRSHPSPEVRDAAPVTEPFSVPGFRGEVVVSRRPADLATEIARLLDPASALRTLHWGRNYLYLARFVAPDDRLEVVVKQFRQDGLRARLQRWLSASKAERAWRMARAIAAAGFATPEPILLAESTRRGGPAFFVSRFEAGTIEVRYLLRAINAGTARQDFPDLAPPGRAESLLAALGKTARRLHDAGFWHRDLSAGNVLVRFPAGGGQERGDPELLLVDLNRARPRRRIGVLRRSRDLSRLPIFEPEARRIFLEAYWEAPVPPLKRALQLFFQRAFLAKNSAKQRLRRVQKRLTAPFLPRRAHPHIPPPPQSATLRDRVVWDPLSDQPHQHAGRSRKLVVRLADLPAHAVATAVVLASAPRIWRRYRELTRGLYRTPVAWGVAGVCIRPLPEAPQRLLAAIEDLGVRHLLLRLHPWESDHDAEEALARELAGRGYDLAFSLPQNRALVRDPAAWRAAIEELAERFTPYGRSFQVGQAINRSKWGIWRSQDYLRLAVEASEILRRRPGIEVLGPAVIDFELHHTAAVLNAHREGLFFDAVASLLYVDRRGGPENRQAGFDTVGKVALLAAIAGTARNSTGRCWITEVNWPLAEGPHSPAGRSVAVSEEEQADYLVRYVLLALGTGLVERVYWWQLVARGYGLVDLEEGGTLRRRPSYLAFRTMLAELAGTSFVRPLPAAEGARLYAFRKADGGTVVVGWSVAGELAGHLAGLPSRVTGRDGEVLAVPASTEVELGPSPRYFHLERGPVSPSPATP